MLELGGSTDVRIDRGTHAVWCPSAASWVRAFLRAAPVPAGARSRRCDRIVGDALADLDPDRAGDAFTFRVQAEVAIARR